MEFQPGTENRIREAKHQLQNERGPDVKLSCAPRGMVVDKQLGYRERARADISCAENIERFHVMDHEKKFLCSLSDGMLIAAGIGLLTGLTIHRTIGDLGAMPARCKGVRAGVSLVSGCLLFPATPIENWQATYRIF